MPSIRSRRQRRSALRAPILALFVPRTIFLWIVVRVTLAAFGMLLPGRGPQTGHAVRFVSIDLVTAVLVAAVVAALVLADVRALRERAFLANLGIGTSTAAAVAFVTSLGLEAATAVILGSIA